MTSIGFDAATGFISEKIRLRFLARVNVHAIVVRPDLGPCSIWTGTILTSGYGQLRVGGGEKKARAHRISWVISRGPIPAGMKVLHHCDNPPCVEDIHLFLGTDADNRADCVAKGRQSRVGGEYKSRPGALNGNAKEIPPQQIEMISELHRNGVPKIRIAQHVGIPATTVNRIIQGDHWCLRQSRKVYP